MVVPIAGYRIASPPICRIFRHRRCSVGPVHRPPLRSRLWPRKGSSRDVWIFFLHTDLEGRSRPFPRSLRILKGFDKKASPTTKKPLPKEVVYALAHKLCLRRGWRVAFAVVVQFDTYLRAHSLFDLEASDFLPPPKGVRSRLKKAWSLLVAPLERGVPTKTGLFNESILIGDKEAWLPCFMDKCVSQLPRTGKVFDFSHEEYALWLQQAARELSFPYRV